MFNTNLDDYYTFDEAATILEMKKAKLRSLFKEEGIEPLKLSSVKVYYSKENVKMIAKKIKEIKEKYCSPSELKKSLWYILQTYGCY
ncbi:MerR family transcriptional regulator [Bacillus paranthracis]